MFSDTNDRRYKNFVFKFIRLIIYIYYLLEVSSNEANNHRGPAYHRLHLPNPSLCRYLSNDTFAGLGIEWGNHWLNEGQIG